MISKRSAQKEGKFLLPHLREGMRFLDCGCGPGTITVGFASAVGPSGSVVAFDIDQNSLNLAKAAAEEQNLHNIEFVQGTVEKLPFEDASFDVVWMHAVCSHIFSKRDIFFNEFRRVLKPNGILAIRDSCSQLRYPPNPCLDRLVQMMAQMIEKNGGDMQCGLKLKENLLRLGFHEVYFGIEADPLQLSLEEKVEMMSKVDFIGAGFIKDQAEAHALFAEVQKNSAEFLQFPGHLEYTLWAEIIVRV